jgi:hypothetical protein
MAAQYIHCERRGARLWVLQSVLLAGAGGAGALRPDGDG